MPAGSYKEYVHRSRIEQFLRIGILCVGCVGRPTKYIRSMHCSGSRSQISKQVCKLGCYCRKKGRQTHIVAAVFGTDSFWKSVKVVCLAGLACVRALTTSVELIHSPYSHTHVWMGYVVTTKKLHTFVRGRGYGGVQLRIRIEFYGLGRRFSLPISSRLV